VTGNPCSTALPSPPLQIDAGNCNRPGRNGPSPVADNRGRLFPILNGLGAHLAGYSRLGHIVRAASSPAGRFAALAAQAGQKRPPGRRASWENSTGDTEPGRRYSGAVGWEGTALPPTISDGLWQFKWAPACRTCTPVASLDRFSTIHTHKRCGMENGGEWVEREGVTKQGLISVVLGIRVPASCGSHLPQPPLPH